jgi:hypothetical protein
MIPLTILSLLLGAVLVLGLRFKALALIPAIVLFFDFSGRRAALAQGAGLWRPLAPSP